MTSPIKMGPPITSASLPGSAINAPTPNLPGGGLNLPAGPIPQLDLKSFGATPLPVQNLLNSMGGANPQGVSPAQFAQALIATTTAPNLTPNPVGNDGGNSFMHRVMDLLNIGDYATATAAEQGIDTKNADIASHMNPFEAAGDVALNTVLGFGHGIAGAFGDSRPGDKTLWEDVLMRHGPDAALLNGTQKTMPDYQQNEANKFLNDQDGGHRPTDLTRPVTDADIRKVLTANTIEGVGLDMAGDPLQVMGAYSKVGSLAGKGIKAILGGSKDASRVADMTNFENLLKDYKNPADVGVTNEGPGQVPNDIQTVANANGVQVPNIPAPGSMLGSEGAVEKELAQKGAGISATPVNPADVAKIPPGLITPNENLNSAFKSGLQNAIAGPSSAADIVQAAKQGPKIDADFFNNMLRDNMKVTEESPNAAPPVSAEPKPPIMPATGAYSEIANESVRNKLINTAVGRVLRTGDGEHWALNLANEFRRAGIGDMNDLEKTGAFLDRMKSRLPNLRSADLNKLKYSLGKTLEADQAEHLAKNKALKASELITRVANGDSAATAATRPSGITLQPLSAEDASIGQKIVQKYTGQILGKAIPPGIKNPEAYLAKIKSGATKQWSGPKQVNMFQDIANEIRKTNPKLPVAPVMSRAAKILGHVEDHFINSGAIPHSAADARYAVPLRLTDVFNKIPAHLIAQHSDLLTTIIKSAFTTAGEVSSPSLLKIAERAPELKDAFDQAFEASKAGGAISEIPSMQKGVQAGQATAEEAINSGKSDARIAGDKTLAGQAAADITRMAGGGEGAANTAKNIINQMYDGGDKFQSAVTKNHLNTLAALSKDDISPNTSNVLDVNKALSKIIGGPRIGALGGIVGPQANAVGWMGSRVAGSYGLFGERTSKLVNYLGQRFTPAFGNKDLRPIFVQGIASARAINGHDAQIYNNLFKQIQHDPETLKAGMLAAQGHKPAVIGSDAEKWSKQFLAHMENMVGSEGLTKIGLLSNTTAARGQLLMKELNAAGKRFGLPGKFTNGNKVEDAMGNFHDLSQGADWLKSWQTWKIENPIKFMMQMSNTINHATREAKMWDEIASRFGSLGKTAIPEIPRLKGYAFHPDMQAQIRQFAKNLNDFKKPNSKFGRLADLALTKFKTAATIYLPAHHVRAALGDVYLSWLAGVEDPSAYSQALKVMRSQADRYKGFEDSGDLTGYGAVDNAIARATGRAPVSAPRGSDIVFTLKNGVHVTNDMVYTYMFQHGLLPTANHLLDIPEEDAMARIIAPFDGRVSSFLNHATELREHYIRTAHFIDVMKRTGGTFKNAAEKAGADVRRWHPDGTDLTDFERRTVRRVIPFYSWSRKVMPLIMESLLMRPTKISAYPRLMYATGVATGALNPQTTSEADPFPTDALFPNWLREKGVGPIFGDVTSGYTSMTPNIPSMDILEQISGLTSGNQSTRANQFSSLLNPGIRVPEELMTGQTLGGAAIMTPKSGYGEYLLKQIPQVQQYSGITNITSTDPNQPAGTLNIDKLLNFLAATGLENDSQYQKQAKNDYMTNQRIQAGTGF